MGQRVKSSSFVVSKRTLKILTAIVWYIGSTVLIIKGGSLLLEANELKPELNWPVIAAITGVFLGSLKAKFIFIKSCQNNLERIKSLAQPLVWEFFSQKFFLMLTVMIFFGFGLSRLAHGNYKFLICVAIIDISISVALLGSSYAFWKKERSN